MGFKARTMSRLGARIGGAGAGGRGAAMVRANPKAYNLAAKGSSKADATRAFMAATDRANAQIGSKYAARGLGIGALGTVGMSRRNSSQQQTMYRGPMSTGRGIGRYS